MKRCVCLDVHGRRCRRRATYQTHYFGDARVNPRLPSFVMIEMCAEHVEVHDGLAEHAWGRVRKIRGGR